MSAVDPLVAIGRSRLLLDSVEHLAARGHRFAAIVTAPPSPEYDVGPAEFAALAGRLGSELFVVERGGVRPEVAAAIEGHRPAAGISVNWQYVLPGSFLDLFPHGVLNLHLGNLPDYKGNATVNWSILNGENEIHANVHRMAVELDAGDVIARAPIPLDESTYVGDVLARAQELAPELFGQALERLADDPAACVVQGSTAGLRCYPRLPEDGLLDWTRPAGEVARLVRASSHPYPGAYSFLGGRRITVWRAAVSDRTDFLAVPGHVLGPGPGSTLLVACGEGALELQEVTLGKDAVEPAALTRSIRARFSTS
ncbi:methionyl-tRNA formyltransferase [Pedococcus sp. NPDC057267]|uniref:methionyl-tRNA formyltransferase n=1 Tax=Pedococcus sp. NPDC057267 TaxID=3346077 RepID=UPI00362AE91C